MNHEASDIIGMGVKRFHFLHGVVVENPDLQVITTTYQPLFPSDESGCSHRSA